MKKWKRDIELGNWLPYQDKKKNPVQPKVELEKLIQKIENKKIPDYDQFKTELKHFTLTLEPQKQKDVIKKDQRDLVKALTNNKNLTMK